MRLLGVEKHCCFDPDFDFDSDFDDLVEGG